MRPLLPFVAAALAATLQGQQDGQIVFRSDVSLVRVDVRVSDRSSRTIPNLTAGDFELRDNGKVQPIRNFASEEMPLDVLFLIDVSASMRPHVERLVDATQSAFETLKPNDHVGIMVFDRVARMRHPLGSIEAAESAFRSLLRQESFNGGTDITRGIIEAAKHVQRKARQEARRAIVILTDDRTELDRDEVRAGNALIAADAVLSALIAPDAMGYMRTPGGGRGGGYPGGNPFPGGGRYPDIIFGRRYPPIPIGDRTKSAGTTEIALESGGDSFPVGDASALHTTLARLRQRYSLYFTVPGGAKSGEVRSVTVDLASSARRRFPDAELKYRRDYRAPEGTGPAPAGEVTESAGAASDQTAPASDTTTASTPADSEARPASRAKRRTAGETYGSSGPNPQVGSGSPDSKAASDPKPATAGSPTPSSAPTSTGGWRRAGPEDMVPPPADPAITKSPKKP